MAGGIQISPLNAERCMHTVEETPQGTRITVEGYALYRSEPDAMLQTNRITLVRDKPELIFETNLKSMIEIHYPRSISSAIQFAIGSSEDVVAGMKEDDGSYNLVPLTYEPDEWNRYARRFRSRELESGSLCVLNDDKNIAAIADFKPDEVRMCSLSGDENVTLGIRSTQKPVEPGDELNFSFRLRFAGGEAVR
jgi:hypothetical protein